MNCLFKIIFAGIMFAMGYFFLIGVGIMIPESKNSRTQNTSIRTENKSEFLVFKETYLFEFMQKREALNLLMQELNTADRDFRNDYNTISNPKAKNIIAKKLEEINKNRNILRQCLSELDNQVEEIYATYLVNSSKAEMDLKIKNLIAKTNDIIAEISKAKEDIKAINSL